MDGIFARKGLISISFLSFSFSFLLSSSNLATKVVMTDEVEHDTDCSVELSFLKRIGRLFAMRYKHNYNSYPVSLVVLAS